MKYLEIPVFILVIGLIIISLAYCNSAQAWVGYGRLADEGAQRADGSWRQYGDPSVFFKRNDKSMGYQIEFGGKTKWKWLGWTIGYQDTGGKTLYGRWINDFDYAKKNFGKEVFHQSVLLESHSRGFIFTFDPQYTTKNKRWTVYAKVGVKAWRSKTKYCWSADTIVLTTCANSDSGGWRETIKGKGFTFYHVKGIQVNFKRHSIYFEHGVAKGDYDTISFISNSRPYILGMRWGF